MSPATGAKVVGAATTGGAAATTTPRPIAPSVAGTPIAPATAQRPTATGNGVVKPLAAKVPIKTPNAKQQQQDSDAASKSKRRKVNHGMPCSDPCPEGCTDYWQRACTAADHT